jgi:AAA domain-containing protein
MSSKQVGSAELFPTDTPLPSKAMIGRSDDVDRLAAQLIGGGNVVVAGARRTGKTSTCEAALEVCRAETCHTASVDLFRTASAAELAEELTLALLVNRSPLRRAVDEARRAGRSLREALTATATYRARADLGEDLELAFDLTLAREDPGRALRTALELPQRLARADGVRVVLLIDEFQEITSGIYGNPDVVTRQMRAIFQRSPDVSVLFAGSVAHVIRELFAPGDRALSQFGSAFALGAITTEEWLGGLRRRFRRGRRTITDSALGRLVDAGEQHPRATMLIAQQTYQESLDAVESKIDDALVLTGLARAMRADRLKHEQSLELIRRTGRYAQVVARNVARGEQLYLGVESSAASRTLDRLRDGGILDRGTGRGEWSIADPLLRRYLAALAG